MAKPILSSIGTTSNRPLINVPPGTASGRLIVITEVPRLNGKRALLVRCECGTEKVVRLYSVLYGTKKTCGCGWRTGTHGQSGKHGQGGASPTYRSWMSMNARCSPTNTAPKFIKCYSARGIGIDPRWRQFENFFADMGKRPAGKTLERIDNDGNYTKDNCRWATPAEQLHNTRRNCFVIIDGKRLCAAEAARLISVNFYTIRNRSKRHQISLQAAFDYYINHQLAAAPARRHQPPRASPTRLEAQPAQRPATKF